MILLFTNLFIFSQRELPHHKNIIQPGEGWYILDWPENFGLLALNF
jgi:hypothetical protein